LRGLPVHNFAIGSKHSRYSNWRREFMIRAKQVLLHAKDLAFSFEFSELFHNAFRLYLPATSR